MSIIRIKWLWSPSVKYTPPLVAPSSPYSFFTEYFEAIYAQNGPLNSPKKRRRKSLVLSYYRTISSPFHYQVFSSREYWRERAFFFLFFFINFKTILGSYILFVCLPSSSSTETHDNISSVSKSKRKRNILPGRPRRIVFIPSNSPCLSLIPFE